MTKSNVICVALLLILSTLYLNAQRNCGTMDYLQQQINENPERINTIEQIESQTREWIKKNNNEKMATLVTIPVVFHVVYNNSTENISDAQILSQLQVLNDDFRRLNSDQDNTWPQADDTEIEFCLASVDPNGNSTSGITRTSTSVSSFGTNDQVKFTSQGGKDAWPASDYLNFWVCDISGGILGYAQFPGGPDNTDGVVCDYQYVGTIGTATSPFDLGRTATHEVGHWLNLRHIWGDGNCNFDDFVSDTPTSDAANYGCATGHVSCGSTDMVQNYMDYSDDACMNLYTTGQKGRMQALFGPGGSRVSLLSSGACGSAPTPTCTDGVQNGNETGVDCGGPDCPPCSSGCNDHEVSLNLIFDNYPEETSWEVRNSSGQLVESGGTYGSEPDGSTLVIDMCLVDDCYDFTIFDTYGDGICCGYGNGSYQLTEGSTILAEGGNFGSSESTNFCLGGGPAPSCTDGVQNGNETGVDCGGPDCPPCPSCTDGIQNGNETGVDCGGPDCPPCPSCTDGVQNGNETGVDCGGPDCPPCPSCTDGVQNGDETGVDCGGTDCPPCPSGCNDHQVTLSLTLDSYPEETSWEIKNSSGQQVESGGTYGSEPDGSTLVIDMCLVDDCYDFTIFDTYGDGICCGYGNGSYQLSNGSTVLAEGGNFGSSETTNFCLGGGPAPSCTDGIQNGNETGVDCGGPDCPPCGGGSTVLFGHYFETGWDGWIDGGSDCYRYSGSRSWEGSYSIRIRDNSGVSSSMTSQAYDVSAYNSLELEFYFYPNSMENGEDFWLRYFDGNVWHTIATYTRGINFQNNNFYVATVTINNGNYNFANDAQFRFQCDASGNADRVYIDAVTLTASGASSRINYQSISSNITLLESDIELFDEQDVEDFRVFPNPATDRLSLVSEEMIESVEIYSITGKLVFHIQDQHLSKEVQIDINALDPGLYIMAIKSDGELVNQKFIKQ